MFWKWIQFSFNNLRKRWRRHKWGSIQNMIRTIVASIKSALKEPKSSCVVFVCIKTHRTALACLLLYHVVVHSKQTNRSLSLSAPQFTHMQSWKYMWPSLILIFYHFYPFRYVFCQVKLLIPSTQVFSLSLSYHVCMYISMWDCLNLCFMFLPFVVKCLLVIRRWNVERIVLYRKKEQKKRCPDT